MTTAELRSATLASQEHFLRRTRSTKRSRAWVRITTAMRHLKHVQNSSSKWHKSLTIAVGIGTKRKGRLLLKSKRDFTGRQRSSSWANNITRQPISGVLGWFSVRSCSAATNINIANIVDTYSRVSPATQYRLKLTNPITTYPPTTKSSRSWRGTQTLIRK